MSARKPFDKLRAAIDADPKRRTRVDQEKQIMRDVLALHKLREARGVTQVELAEAWDTSQANISRVEHEDDVYYSTLRRYVEALGGQLDVTAIFPDETFRLGPHTAASSAQERRDKRIA